MFEDPVLNWVKNICARTRQIRTAIVAFVIIAGTGIVTTIIIPPFSFVFFPITIVSGAFIGFLLLVLAVVMLFCRSIIESMLTF